MYLMSAIQSPQPVSVSTYRLFAGILPDMGPLITCAGHTHKSEPVQGLQWAIPRAIVRSRMHRQLDDQKRCYNKIPAAHLLLQNNAMSVVREITVQVVNFCLVRGRRGISAQLSLGGIW